MLTQDYVLTAQIRPAGDQGGSILELHSPSWLRFAAKVLLGATLASIPLLLACPTTGLWMLAPFLIVALAVGLINRWRAMSIRDQFASAVWSCLAAYQVAEFEDPQPYRALPELQP
jgi:hypothetical protein